MIEVHSTTCPGLYRCDWPDSAFAAGADKVVIGVRGPVVDTAMEEWVLKDFDISDIEDYVSDIYSDCVLIQATQASWLAEAGVLSNIWSETTAIAAAGGALTSAQAAMLSDIQVTQASDALLIQSDLSDILSAVTAVSAKIGSDVLLLEAALDSDFLQVETKLDSDMVLVVADHDKTQSDVVDLSTKLASDVLALEGALDSDALLYISDLSDIISHLVVLDAAIDSDALLYTTSISDVKSAITILDAAIDSDALLADADHDKTQSDIALLSTKQDSDMVIVATATSDILSLATLIRSDTAVIEAGGGALTSAQAAQLTTIASDIVLVYSDTAVIEAGGGALTSAQAAQLTTIASDVVLIDQDTSDIKAKIDSDALLYIADHDKTQSDILLLSGKQDSDMVIVATATSDIHSLAVLVRSDTTAIELAGGALTSAQVVTLSDIASQVLINKSAVSDTLSLLTLVRSDTTAIEAGGGALTSAQDAKLTTIASDIVIVASDVLVIDQDTSDLKAKVDSDAVLADADHDKTQSDILLLSGKQDSDMVVVATATSDIKSLVTLVRSDTGLLDGAQAELAAVPAAAASPLAKLNWLFALSRNKITETGTLQTLRNDADGANIATAVISDDGATLTRAEFT